MTRHCFNSQSLQLLPENYLLGAENQLKRSYQVYNLVSDTSDSDDLYGFPTVSNTVDFTNHNGESGRTMNVLAAINGNRVIKRDSDIQVRSNHC